MCYENPRTVHIVVSESMSTDEKNLIQATMDPKKAEALADKLNEVNPGVRYSTVTMDVTF